MIKCEYNLNTGEATAKAVGSGVILTLELKALRNLLMKNEDLMKLWLDVLAEAIGMEAMDASERVIYSIAKIKEEGETNVHKNESLAG